jgi:hypothetical protein
MLRKMLLAAPLAAIGLATSASAYDPIVEARGWQQVAHDKDQGCEAEVRGNGQIFYVYAVGLGSGGAGRYEVTNRDMPPIDWSITADENGEWARYYIPILPNHRGGTVRVNISTVDCSLAMAFDWRTGYKVIETDGTTHIVNDDDYAAQQSDEF